MKVLKEVSDFLKVTTSIVFAFMGTALLVGGFYRWDIYWATLGICLLIYSDTTWLCYKDSIRRKHE